VYLNAGLLARSQYAFGKSCDRPTRSRFSVVFLGPRADAELVPKFHVALHASHAALPMLTSKFRPKVAPHIIFQISPNAALPRIISKFKIAHERSKTLLNFSPCYTSHPTFSISKRLTFTKPTFTRRTSGHCLGTFVAANLNLCPSLPLKSSAYRYSPPLSRLSLSSSERFTFSSTYFTRRTNGHCLGTLIAENCSSFSPR
jgi:hypothetical protein